MYTSEIISYLLVGAGLLCAWWWLTGSFPWKKNPLVGWRTAPTDKPAQSSSPITTRPAPADDQRLLLEEMRGIRVLLAEILQRLDGERPEVREQPAASLPIPADPLDLLPPDTLEIESVAVDPTEQVYTLADRGLASRDIARQVGLSRGEVDLLLRLRAVAVAVGE
ncbi:MAG TPA: hypothetical protein VGM23_17935 [Armatimonadota bacterium]|jgi:hypothetical protein